MVNCVKPKISTWQQGLFEESLKAVGFDNGARLNVSNLDIGVTNEDIRVHIHHSSSIINHNHHHHHQTNVFFKSPLDTIHLQFQPINFSLRLESSKDMQFTMTKMVVQGSAEVLFARRSEQD
uniref:Uncharacterized protein n=1 Tax=Lactuca sativa TaxID=4236 RepID=A0A9R1W301_LACSA|nr:hypothetical protein LSAT_V11C300155200 [Lactuca sativa]